MAPAANKLTDCNWHRSADAEFARHQDYIIHRIFELQGLHIEKSMTFSTVWKADYSYKKDDR